MSGGGGGWVSWELWTGIDRLAGFGCCCLTRGKRFMCHLLFLHRALGRSVCAGS